MKRPTPAEIEAAKTPAGGWTRETLESWGVSWPPQEGWRKKLLKGSDAWSAALDRFRRVAQPQAPSFYDSAEWRDLRYRALKKHGAVCQCCKTRATPGNPIQVDHIKPRSRFPELEYDINNLQVLCKDCNLGKRAWDQTDWRNR